MKSRCYLFGILIFLQVSVGMAQWTKEKNYPASSTDAVVEFAIGDSIYIGGGSAGSTSFYKFDPTTDTWTRKADIPQRAFGISFSIGSKGYMGLGQADPQGTGQASVTNDFWEYDPASDHWTQKANFPGIARDAAFAFAIGNKAYAGGGTDTGYLVYGDFYSYDPANNKWDTLNGLPDYLYFNSTFVIGNYGYLATGVQRNNEISSMWQYDPSSDSWNQMTDFPGAPRESAVSFALDGRGYVGLGQSQYTKVFTDFYSYDPTKDSWAPVTAFPATHGRGWAAGIATTSAAFVGLGTYFVGSSLVTNSDFWEFSPAAGVLPTSSTKNSIAVFPNPSSDFVTLAIPQGKSAEVFVRNSLGAVCLTARANPGSELNISSLPSGIYNLEIISGDYHAAQRIVKE